jgi:N-acetylglutamate synthase-like GNAT family acetyltransferase
MPTLRKACERDLASIKPLLDAHRHELGFVIRPALQKRIQADEVLVACDIVGDVETIIGVMAYHHRRDEQTTLYHIVVAPAWRKRGIGRRLIQALQQEAQRQGKHHIQLKCPCDLPANNFYPRLGFQLHEVQDGRKRALNVWRLGLR